MGYKLNIFLKQQLFVANCVKIDLNLIHNNCRTLLQYLLIQRTYILHSLCFQHAFAIHLLVYNSGCQNVPVILMEDHIPIRPDRSLLLGRQTSKLSLWDVVFHENNSLSFIKVISTHRRNCSLSVFD